MGYIFTLLYVLSVIQLLNGGLTPYNESGKAVKGVEYFETKKVDKEDKIEAIEEAKKNNHNHLIDKLDG